MATPICPGNAADIINLTRSTADQGKYLWFNWFINNNHNYWIKTKDLSIRYLVLFAMTSYWLDFIAPTDWSITRGAFAAFEYISRLEFVRDSESIWKFGLKYANALLPDMQKKIKKLSCPASNTKINIIDYLSKYQCDNNDLEYNIAWTANLAGGDDDNKKDDNKKDNNTMDADIPAPSTSMISATTAVHSASTTAANTTATTTTASTATSTSTHMEVVSETEEKEQRLPQSDATKFGTTTIQQPQQQFLAPFAGYFQQQPQQQTSYGSQFNFGGNNTFSNTSYTQNTYIQSPNKYKADFAPAPKGWEPPPEELQRANTKLKTAIKIKDPTKYINTQYHMKLSKKAVTEKYKRKWGFMENDK